MLKQNSLQKIIVIAIALTALNALASMFYYRFDMTADGRYSLSESGKTILKNLKKTATITLYFSEDLTPELENYKREVTDILEEMHQVAGTHLIIKNKNPNQSEEAEKEAQQVGIQAQLLTVQERDKDKQQRVYLGAEISYDGKPDVLPVIPPGSNAEYLFATSLKKLSATQKPVIGFLSGQKEATLEEMPDIERELSSLYDVKPIMLNDSIFPSGITPKMFKAIAIVDPKDSFSNAALTMLKYYVDAGGNLLLASAMAEIDQQTGTGKLKETNLNDFLKIKGISIEPKFVVDAQCGQASVPKTVGDFQFEQTIQFPYFPLLSNFPDNPITKGLHSLILPFASSVKVVGGQTPITAVLCATSSHANLIDPKLKIEIEKQWTEKDFPLQNIPLAISAESKSSKMIVIGCGTFANSSKEQPIQPDNLNLFVNSMDWLAGDMGLVSLRNKSFTFRPIENVSEGEKSFLKWLNALLPIVLIIVYGFIRNSMNKGKRRRWMEEGPLT